ncbi:MAG: hypothetical protein V1798_08605 [Pseudomonadota bacterium]
MLVFSAHADTNFYVQSLTLKNDGYFGPLDNYVGVFAAMQAFFSGQIQGEHTRIVLTDHEETSYQGALELRDQLSPEDMVVVVDVTGIEGDMDFTIEKCADPVSRRFVQNALSGFHYRLFENSPDPISDSDEVDVYGEKCPHSFFLGIPCLGGDYNRESVFCRKTSVDAAARAMIALSRAYAEFRPLKLVPRIQPEDETLAQRASGAAK